jgi:activating signal cointegrator 1
MRVLTVQQPFATLIALGEKKVEYRSWPTSHKEALAIASSKGFPKYRRTQCEERRIKQQLRTHGLSVDDLKRDCGKVLCITQIVECRKESDGSYGFVLRRKPMKVFHPPISIPPGGFHLGLWKWK